MRNETSKVRRHSAQAPGALLTGTNRWPSPARIAMVLAKVGCRVSAICPAKHSLLYTRTVHETFHYNSLRPIDSLREAIEASKPQIIVPCDDRAVQHLHELHARVRGENGADSHVLRLIERSLGSPEHYEVVSSRYGVLKTAREEGIRVPRTAAISSVPDLKRWESEQPLPWVLKSDGTFGGMGVKIAETRKQGARFFGELNRPYRLKRILRHVVIERDSFWVRPWWKGWRPGIIAQEHIRGRAANCAVACWEGSVLAGIGAEVVGSIGETAPAGVVRIVDNPEMMLAAKKIARRLRLSGFFGLDFMIEDGTGALYLIEMNPRCTPLCHLRLGKGKDLVAALWARLSGESVPEAPAITANEMVAYFPRAWSLNRDLLDSSYQDVPADEPELMTALLHPWPVETPLTRFGNAVAAFFAADKPPAQPSASPEEAHDLGIGRDQ